jgi:hypothetical protein
MVTERDQTALEWILKLQQLTSPCPWSNEILVNLYLGHVLALEERLALSLHSMPLVSDDSSRERPIKDFAMVAIGGPVSKQSFNDGLLSLSLEDVSYTIRTFIIYLH